MRYQINTESQSPPGTRSRLEKTLRGHYIQDTDSGLVPERYHPQSLKQSDKSRLEACIYPAVIRLVTLSDLSSVNKGEEDGDSQKSVMNDKGKVREEPGHELSNGLTDQNKVRKLSRIQVSSD